MDYSTHEENLCESLQIDIEKFKIAVTFLTGYNGIFIVTDKNIKICFAKSNTDKVGFIKITTPKGSYELENLKNQIKKNFLEKRHFSEADFWFTFKPNFSTLRFLIESSRQDPLNSFTPEDSI